MLAKKMPQAQFVYSLTGRIVLASIGPKITILALSDPAVYEACSPIVIGDAAVIDMALDDVGMRGQIKIHAVSDVSEALFTPGTIDVYDMKKVDAVKLERGKVSAMAAVKRAK